AYGSQFQRTEGDAATPINDPRFLPAMEARLAEFGRQVGVAYAEPFVMAVPPLLHDPVSDLTRGKP
ncbi:MAG: hypothetical protein HKO53_16790, partial [Gemmatimonadetes bacterium]|nr:hypothetical protein [Gemmatimonadota bacterium]